MKCKPEADLSCPRYLNPLGSLLDQISFFMVYPWASLAASVISYYIESKQPCSWICRIIEKFILGPFFAFIFLCFTPVGISGFFLWVFVCTFFNQKKYSYLCLREDPKGCDQQKFTFATANVLLGNELFCRINNMSSSLSRYKKIGRQLMQQSNQYLQNLTNHSIKKEDVVITDLPDVDILCLQEVWERYWAATLIDRLRSKYSYFIHDVGDYSIFSNYCIFGSGLFVASKYPIEAAHFHAFQNRRKFAKYFSFGVLSLKVRLDDQRVAYVSNLHGQAYQGTQPILFHQMTETLSAVNSFRVRTLKPDVERVAFDVICGDFNFDNMSSGDEATQRHALFYQYADVCSRMPGVDETWTVGTELRQIRMHESTVTTAEGFRRVLIDDVRRRFYILDADVQVHTKALASADAAPDENGEVVAKPWGGKRRIDRILLRRDTPARMIGYAFSTVLCGMTDHLAVAATLEVDDDFH